MFFKGLLQWWGRQERTNPKQAVMLREGFGRFREEDDHDALRYLTEYVGRTEKSAARVGNHSVGAWAEARETGEGGWNKKE